MAEGKYNQNNPAVTRILQEMKEMQSNPSSDFMSLPLEENIFEWQFAIRGPCDTAFEGGIYHGRIQLPAEYPFKPPAFMLLTPNGRFEIQTKICLSISNYHPEHWLPSWSVRTALVALIAFMPTKPNGAVGSLDYKEEEKQDLAMKSRLSPPKYGSPARQKLIDEIHQHMLSMGPSPVTSHDGPDAEELEMENNHSMAAGVEETIHENGVLEAEIAEADVPPSGARPAVALTAEAKLMLRVQKSGDDRLFTVAAIGFAVAILLLLLKKFIKSSAYGALFMDQS